MSAPATGILFYEPRAKPLSTIGLIQPGAYYQFYLTGTLTPATVYADGALTTPLSQTPGSGGTTAASDGRLPPIYLNPAVIYRVRLFSIFGTLLEDTDPFVVPGSLVQSVSVVSFGADPSGVADSTTAFNNALNSGASVVYAPIGTFTLSSGIIIPGGVLLIGAGAAPGSTGPGTTLSFSSSIATLVTVNNLTSNASGGVKQLNIVRQGGTPPVGSKGLYVAGGFNIILKELYVVNNAIDYFFYSQSTLGISCHADMLFSALASDAHIVFDTWPEFYCTNSRFGDGGPGDYAANTYVRCQGGQGGTAGGPNTIIFDACHFNQGVNFPSHFWEFVNLNGSIPSIDATGFKILGCHIEGVNTACFYSDSTWNGLNEFYIVGSTFNTVSIPMFALNAATRPANWYIVGNGLFVSNITLTPTLQFNFVKFIGNYIGGAVTLTGVSGDTVVFYGNTHEGTTTINGTFARLTLDGDGNTTLVWNGTVSSPDLRGGFGVGTWIPAFAFSGGGSVTYSAQSGSYTLNGNNITVDFLLIVNGTSSPSGNVTVTNLPYTAKANAGSGGGGVCANVANLTGVTTTGATTALVAVNTTTFGLNVWTTSGSSQLQGSNITNTTAISGTFTYKWQ